MTDEYILTEQEAGEIACAINHYLQAQYRRITDFNAVIENRELVEPGIWAYHCPCQTVYLDDNAYAVNCGRQYVSRIYYNEHGEALYDQENMEFMDNLEPEEYDHMTAKVYWDPREDMSPPPEGFEGDTSLFPCLIYLGDLEWRRDSPGGGGVV